jgi:hypothetical protein
MKRNVSFLAVAGLLFSTVPAFAQPFVMNNTTYQVQDIAGSGSNESLLEIDFGTNAAPQPLLFGFEWDGSTAAAPTGRDVLVALQANNNGLTFTDTFFRDFDEHLLNTIAYNALQPPDDYPNDFWLYFNSNDGQTWSETDLGYDALPVTNGGFFGWALQNDDPNEFVVNPPFFPPSHSPAALVAAPEPATLGLAAVGLLSLCLRRRR